jgi:hypothetical protein
MAMAAAAFAGVNAQSPAPAPVIIVQKPTSAELVRAAFNENRIVIKTKQNNRAI